MAFNKVYIKLIVVTMVVLGFVVQLPLSAAKAPKVEICHFDSDKGEYKLLEISGNAVQKHIDKHGDMYPDGELLDAECNVKVATKVFARAYVNLDGLPGYDENVDIEIARFEDTNGNGVASAGDTVITSQYPKNFDLANIDVGDFTKNEHVINASVDVSTPGVLILAQGGQEGNFIFSDYLGREEYFEGNALLGTFTNLIDDPDSSGCPGEETQDAITVQTGSPSLPDSAVPFMDCEDSSGLCNNDWLEVDITL